MCIKSILIMEDYISVLSLYDLEELDAAPGDEFGARTSLWRGPEQPKTVG